MEEDFEGGLSLEETEKLLNSDELKDRMRKQNEVAHALKVKLQEGCKLLQLHCPDCFTPLVLESTGMTFFYFVLFL